MDRTELARIAEAILFAAGDPVPAERLAFAAQCEIDEVNDVLRELADSWAFDRCGCRGGQTPSCRLARAARR